MPELPEVETIARALREGGRGGESILGLKVSSVDVLWESSIAHPSPKDFLERIVGQTVENTNRRGKYIIIRLNNESLLIHLRMSGDLRIEHQKNTQGFENPLEKHDRMVINFSSGLRLVFNDPRKFGRIWLTPSPHNVLANLGYEPFDSGLTVEVLFNLVHRSGRMVKSFLLDQSKLAGLGNIYADEALFQARINPSRSCNSLSEIEVAGLLKAIRCVLNEGIQRNGASIDWIYRGGDFQNYFRVYQRTGEACVVCGTDVKRCVIAQRSTHYCPVCQPVSVDIT